MRRRQAWVLAGLPGVAGLAAGIALERDLPSAPIFVARPQASLAALAVLLGLLASALGLLACWCRERWLRTLQRVAAEERDAQADVHRRFVHRLDHELKNPLTAIRAGLANLNAACRQMPAAQTSLSNVRRQVERLSDLARDLRKLADLETRELEWALVDLEEIIAETVELARTLPGRERRAIDVHLQKVPWALSPVRSDRDLLLLALYNLLDNACKFSPPDGTVEIRASEDGTCATVEVADTGLGIAREDLPHLGEELYRGRGSHGIEGSGLGLALVRRIVDRLGGEMSIRSRWGQGTVVTLRLPLGRR